MIEVMVCRRGRGQKMMRGMINDVNAGMKEGAKV